MTRVALVTVLLALLVPAAAHAGTYEVWACADSAGKPVPADGWRSEGYGYYSSPANACTGGNGLYAGLNGAFAHAANAETLTWHFHVDAPLKIASYRLWRAVRTEANSFNASPVYWMARQQNSYTGAYVVGPENCPGCGGLGDTTNHFAAANLVAESNLADVRDLFLNAGCGGATGYNCTAEAGTAPDAVSFRMYRSQITLQDDADPVFTSTPSGSLTAGGVLSGTQGLSFSASDSGGGVLRYELEVDGGHTVAEQVICARPYTAVVPCKTAASGSLSFDTATLADGPHTMRVLVVDATATNVAAYGPFAITTSNAPSSCAPAEGTGLSVALDRKRSTIAYGGRLDVVGQAPPGATVRVFSQVSRSGAAARLGRTPIAADATGKFTYRVPAGPSRALRFAYRGGADPLFSCSKPLNVAVKARATLRASPRTIHSGRRVRFTGKLRGGYVPKRGKLIELQAHERGRWRGITTLRTNAKGAFSYRYRFSVRARGTTFPVRVRVRADDSYPFALGTSKRVRVRVR
jgi:hypothetical protein